MSEGSAEGSAAARVALSLSPSDDRTVDAVDSERYRAYIRRAHAGPVAVGEEWAEFVSRGCGTTRDVELRVESVEGGEEIGEGTEFAFLSRG
ncbi:hypothetical protein [Halolamina salifodinae]|uniref:DUF7968 domain-containing protein n=1 Tax=Halolamina salifodinae TaxID=1202767 RepID=A0A8T4H089_9EURY|nr:hypothetical protein [Halolamina salifodinae]MBP1987194.1 hypothetical protein [Halolamina salifodinae]